MFEVVTAALWYRRNRMVFCVPFPPVALSFFPSRNHRNPPETLMSGVPCKETAQAPLWLLFRSPPPLSLSENQDISRDIKDSCCGLNKFLRPPFWKDNGSIIVMLWKLCQSNNTSENASYNNPGVSISCTIYQLTVCSATFLVVYMLVTHHLRLPSMHVTVRRAKI